ncbi:CdaR family protein [Aquimarina hainanensis]|uniref:CdaR family protein n=1 Tax=Aquimarina hainanensis TaxID=1578017 RepID=A0ABW5NH80_9FLAO|nr:CdaR family protein [Aquimarina sp. TRL1]QKX07451.1 hypothetical protein HN014_21870 [Aquimarina sp. TRL1]
MKEQSSIRHRFSFKRNNVKTFLFFLTFTSMLWLFIQFSKNYTREVEVPIRYVNIPNGKILNTTSDLSLKIILNGNGFRLMSNNWKKNALTFDVEDAVTASGRGYSFFIDKQALLLKNNLDFKGRVLSVQKDTIRLKLDENLEKKIPVTINGNVTFTAGYGSAEGVIPSPDSVIVSGAKRIVDTIASIQTEEFLIEGVHKNYSTKVALDRSDFPLGVTVSPLEITASIDVSKFTEGSQEIPVTLINVPDNHEVKVFPKEVKVVYRVGLDTYNTIAPSDFKIIADYQKVAEGSSFLILEIKEYPVTVHDVRLGEKQVQFVILK